MAARWLPQRHHSLKSEARGKQASPTLKPKTSPKPGSGLQEAGPGCRESGVYIRFHLASLRLWDPGAPCFP